MPEEEGEGDSGGPGKRNLGEDPGEPDGEGEPEDEDGKTAEGHDDVLTSAAASAPRPVESDAFVPTDSRPLIEAETYIPPDLEKTREAIRIFEEHDAVSLPEIQADGRGEIRRAGGILRAAGVYMVNQHETHARQLGNADATGQELIRLGTALQGEEPGVGVQKTWDELSAQDQAGVDWVLGLGIPGKGEHADVRQEARRQVLMDVFSEEANEGQKERVRARLVELAQTPQRELRTAILGKAYEDILSMGSEGWTNDKVRKRLGVKKREKISFADLVQVNAIRGYLEISRSTGTAEQARNYEEKVVKHVLDWVNLLDTRESRIGLNQGRASRIIASQETDCTGGVLVAGKIFQILGIDYRFVHVSGHGLTFYVVHKDNELEGNWVDFTGPQTYAGMSDSDIIDPFQTDASPDAQATISDVLKATSRPDSPGVLLYIANPAVLKKMYTANIRKDRSLFVLPPETGHLHPALINKFNELDRNKEQGLQDARVISDLLITLFPNHHSGYHTRALVYEYSGDDTAAIRLYTRAINKDPENIAARMNRGWLYRKLGYLEAAKQTSVIFWHAMMITQMPSSGLVLWKWILGKWGTYAYHTRRRT